MSGVHDKKKKNTPFLLEMQAAIWGMDHFSTYLKGRHFTLFSDHKPLEKLGKVHTRTLNRLQEAMNTFDFEIVYKKGSEMPADFLSRNVIDSISWNNEEICQEQQTDPLIKALNNYLLNRELHTDQKCQNVVRNFANDCFVDNDIVWRRIKRQFEPSRVVIFLPQALVNDVLQEAHGHLLTGHDGVYKTKECIFQCYYWPGMDANISDHLKTCHKCQISRNDHRPAPALLTPLPQPTEPNQRVHADLFGPLRDLGRGKRYILTITDAFTKYVELVSLPNKEAPTVCEAIFNRWICRYSVPLEIVTDQGGEFCNDHSAELYKLLQLTHLHTSSRHPACNSQAKVANKTIAKYLRNLVRDDTLDWEQYLAPLMFSIAQSKLRRFSSHSASNLDYQIFRDQISEESFTVNLPLLNSIKGCSMLETLIEEITKIRQRKTKKTLRKRPNLTSINFSNWYFWMNTASCTKTRNLLQNGPGPTGSFDSKVPSMLSS
jgi:hypothetical protein